MQTAICALTLLSGVIGAGFASGREIVRFFSVHGHAGAAAIVCASCSLLFFFLRLCAKMEREGLSSAQQLCCVRFGARVGGVCAALFFLLFCVTAGAMLAACAEIAALVLPVRHAYRLGMAVSLLMALALSRRGARGLAVSGAALALLLPVLFVRLLLLEKGEACFLPAMTPDLPVRAAADGVSYAALNAAMLLGTAPSLLELESRGRRRGMLLFGALFALLLSLGCAVCMRHAPTALSHPMPFLALSRRLGAGGYLLIAACLYAAALSTLCAMLTGMMGMLPSPDALRVGVCGMLALTFARLGFGALVQSAYPVLGAVCAGLLVLLCT